MVSGDGGEGEVWWLDFVLLGWIYRLNALCTAYFQDDQSTKMLLASNASITPANVSLMFL